MIKNFYREIIVVLVCLFSSIALSKETRKIVAVIDSGIAPESSALKYLCKGFHVDFTGTSLKDMNGHGTNIAGIIANKINTKTHCIAILKYWHTKDNPWGTKYEYDIIKSLYNYVKQINPDYINFSSAGGGFNHYEYSVLSELLDNGTKVVVASGNRGLNLTENACNDFPACYYFDSPNFFVVGYEGKLSNYGGPVKYKRKGINQCGFGVCLTGSSQATANMTAELLSKENR